MNLPDQHMVHLTRRAFLGRGGAGLGAMALAALLNPERAGATDRWRGILSQPHVAPRARRVIWLYMAGGPSHLETLDYKPRLAQLHGQPMPESYTRGQPIAQLQGQRLTCFAPQHPFRRFGRCGHEIAEIFPHVGSVADELCVIRSMKTEAINHDPAHTFMNTGTTISGRPAMGSWLLYGLGSDAENLPGFVVLVSSGRGGQMQPIAARQWSAGFLPSRFQGVKFNSIGDPVLYINNPSGVDARLQDASIQAINELDRIEYGTFKDPEILTRISQYEM